MLVVIKYQGYLPPRANWNHGRRPVTHENKAVPRSQVPRIIQLELEPKSHDSQTTFCPLHKAREPDTEGEAHASVLYTAQPPACLILPITFLPKEASSSCCCSCFYISTWLPLGDQREKPEPEQTTPGRWWHHAVPGAGIEAELSRSLPLISTPPGSSALCLCLQTKQFRIPLPSDEQRKQTHAIAHNPAYHSFLGWFALEVIGHRRHHLTGGRCPREQAWRLGVEEVEDLCSWCSSQSRELCCSHAHPLSLPIPNEPAISWSPGMANVTV